MTNSTPDDGPEITSSEVPVSRPNRFDHVALSVPDLNEATEFFVNCFGARVLFKMERPDNDVAMGAERLGVSPEGQFALAMVELGGSRVELLQWWPTHGETSAISADQVGASHVAVEVEDVAALLDSLRAVAGVRVLGEPMTFAGGATPGLTNAFLRSPWGALIELVSWNWPDI